jgi:putative ABC transport system substrate-binding protein
MRRREFVTLLGGAVTWPLAARAQQPAMPAIGFLHSGSAQQNAERLDAYRRGLKEAGFVEGQNVAIEFRWAAGQNDKLPALAADLIQRHVAVIATPGSTPAAVAAKAATSIIPIVFAVGADPIELGLVASLNHPGGNATGITSMNADIAAKRFELIRELVPQAASYFGLVNPASPLAQPMTKALEAGAATVGIALEILRAHSDAEIDAVMGRLQSTANVMVSGTDALFFVRRAHIAALALRQALPTIFDDREYATAGALASYGADFLNVMELAGDYTGRVLKGQKPADLPAVQAAKFEFVINRKTATTLGIRIPPTLLALADEVIE